jgi:hypothetical protein
MTYASAFARPAFAGLLAVAALASPLSRAEDLPPFQRFGEGYLAAHGAAAGASALPPDKLFAEHYVRASLGLVDVSYPTAFLGDKTNADAFKSQCAALVDLQRRFAELLAGKDERASAGLAGAQALATWVKGWKASAFAKAASAKEKDVYSLAGGGDAERAASAELEKLLSNADVIGIAPREIKRLSIVLAPTRRDFVELLGYAGLVDPAQQAALWTESSSGWTSFWIGWNFVLALEYPGWGEDPEFRSGTPMTKFEPTGREQHTVQNAANALQWLYYGDDDATYLHQAVSMNLAIAVVGEINALEGDVVRGTTGAQTQPYEKFVPGGNPDGGWLPPIPAAPQDMLKDGRWREGKGKDHFAGVLRKYQKEGWKVVSKEKPAKLDPLLLKDQEAHFTLLSSDGSKKETVCAPFLGAAANAKPYPSQAVLLDFKEFFRSYKCCFFDWLARAGDKDPEAAKTKFRTLVRRSGTKGGPKFEALVQEVYGVPLSAANGATDSLEWRFLAWLGKGK